jgi:chromosome segregation ATPase
VTPQHLRRRVPSLFGLIFACFFALLVGAHAEDPPNPTTPPAPAGQTDGAPPAKTTEAPKRKEDEQDPPQATASLGTKVAAALSAMRGQGAAVQQLAERDQTIQTLRIEITNMRREITQRDTELGTLRAERTQIESALRTLETERADVTQTVAQLGFDSRRLPSPASLDQVEDGSPAGAYNKWQELKKSGKHSEARAYSRLHRKAIESYAKTQPQNIED